VHKEDFGAEGGGAEVVDATSTVGDVSENVFFFWFWLLHLERLQRMSVLIVTSLGDLVVDLHTNKCPLTCKNFLKLCKSVLQTLTSLILQFPETKTLLRLFYSDETPRLVFFSSLYSFFNAYGITPCFLLLWIRYVLCGSCVYNFFRVINCSVEDEMEW